MAPQSRTDVVRGIEEIFESVIERADIDNQNENAVPSNTRQQSLRKRFDDNTGTRTKFESVFSRCISFLSTITASLSSKQLSEIHDEQYDAITDVYRFTSGRVRELAHKLDNNPETITEIDIQRLKEELFALVDVVRNANLITGQHTYKID